MNDLVLKKTLLKILYKHIPKDLKFFESGIDFYKIEDENYRIKLVHMPNDIMYYDIDIKIVKQEIRKIKLKKIVK